MPEGVCQILWNGFSNIILREKKKARVTSETMTTQGRNSRSRFQFRKVTAEANADIKNDQKINEFTSVLKQKVLLTDQQSVKVTQILSDLFIKVDSNPGEKDKLIKEAQINIENLLDSKQKLKYDIIKNDLWKKLSL